MITILLFPVFWVLVVSLCLVSLKSKLRAFQKQPPFKKIPRSHRNVEGKKITQGPEISEKNKNQYGSIYSHRDGFRYEVVLTTPSQLKQYYSLHTKDHKKLDSFGAGQYLVALLGECLGFQNGELWTRMRKLFNLFFTHTLAAKTLPAMIAFIDGWILEHDSQNEFSVDAFDFVATVPFTCIAKYLYGNEQCSGRVLTELKNLVPLHSELMTHAFTTFWGRFKIYQYFPFQRMKDLKFFQDSFKSLSLAMVELARDAENLTVASELYKLVESRDLTLDNWIQSLDEILFANIDVTATIMSWSLVEMGRNKHEQARLRLEVLENLQLVDEYCKRTDTVLHRVLLEILRLHPLLWYGFPEQSSSAMVIDGHKIEANTPIVVDQYQLNYKSPLWNPADKSTDYGATFDSDRFLGLNNRDILMSSVTFGSGPRRCLGKNFAEVLIKTEIAKVLSTFEVALEGELKVAADTFVVRPDAQIKLTRLI